MIEPNTCKYTNTGTKAKMHIHAQPGSITILDIAILTF